MRGQSDAFPLSRFPCLVAVFAAILLFSIDMSMARMPEAREDPDRTRVGFHIGAGYGRIDTGDESGVFGATATTPDDLTVGAAFSFDFGYRTRPDMYVELLFDMWLGTLSGAFGNEDWGIFTFGGAVRWYPIGRGAYLRGGFGGGVIYASLNDPSGPTESTDFDDLGLGAFASVGYDIQVTESIVSGPRADFVFVDVGDDVRAVGVNLFFTFSWH